MNVNEIKAAVDAGKQVFWSNTNYPVIKDKIVLSPIVDYFGWGVFTFDMED